MRTFAIVVLLALLLSYSFGFIAAEGFDIGINVDDHTLTPFESVVGVTLAGVIMAVVGFVIALSVVGAIVLAIGAVMVGLLVAGLSVFWPMLLLLAIIVWLVKRKGPAHS
ncbi:hypothetical protein LJ739_18415 [Aestuariibacter halophilus]|uniref:DUF4064 domain-containing protein n=1 Tax=Fluctibacter halophilus TaxID=226011 RepID=A0ABS8GCH5_9ALTE|nr:hypothetical protein [Aestuariibacter halophilus]MCC2618237.1 hypothetical protein [Aestuariibacter halophilus]